MKKTITYGLHEGHQDWPEKDKVTNSPGCSPMVFSIGQHRLCDQHTCCGPGVRDGVDEAGKLTP